MKKWRGELTEMMKSAGYRRMPALRRSSKEQFLLATDYPTAADQPSAEAFIRQAEKAGWHAETDHGWIYLDRKAVFEASDDMPIPGPEALNCLSLLERHAGGKTISDGTAERLLLKAMEEGAEAYERACAKLHAEWSVLLRTSAGIPDVDKRFFGGKGMP